MNKLPKIRKVIIAEDVESISAGIEKALKEFNPQQIVHTRYCDDAWLKLKKAELDNDQFDLLITDLSFKQDHREVKLKGGEELITAVRKDNISCKIIVFSIEDKPVKIQSFFNDYFIDGYVLKSRRDNVELAKAFRSLILGETYMSDEIREKIHSKKNISKVEEIDLLIIRQLCEGMTQDEISQLFQQRDIKPNSISTIEKRLKNLKEDFSAKTNIELVLIFKELGLV
ncbi:helix-turn-helix domain-containing protein [Moheibacter sediminis]|uniref:DNA-binding response regulator, NarL/FixJ family, contains REC and HTH domains n=1 Tax=Moheibacter sediminis TaxID=1434700 RepID=A0A1W1Z2E3_9FLAO|nr:response regulator transcription factor [Moheibacter sediminis]SMC42482.1 DNA-binding response regulator, NarL/FixJ family, contains REC and HTH domains [Moheibacter sediminis]